MRPSYRFAVVVAVLVGLAAVIGARWYGSAEPTVVVDPETRPRLDIPRGPRPAGVPSAETITQMLDRVEAAEVERFGEEEAGRRRRTREELLESRLERDHE